MWRWWIERGKCDGVVDEGVALGILRGSHEGGLGLAEGHRGLCRAQPVTEFMMPIYYTYSPSSCKLRGPCPLTHHLVVTLIIQDLS
jgi:hypothetical protein